MVPNGVLSYKLIWNQDTLINNRTFMVGPKMSIVHRFHCNLFDKSSSVGNYCGILFQNPYAPDSDPCLVVENYVRTYEQNDSLGLNDMKTENYSWSNALLVTPHRKWSICKTTTCILIELHYANVFIIIFWNICKYNYNVAIVCKWIYNFRFLCTNLKVGCWSLLLGGAGMSGKSVML